MPAATTKKSSNKKQRITIKAYKQPPKLPPDFYETTSLQLLQATGCVLLDQVQGKHNNNNTTSSSCSLQNCYTLVAQLVSHQFGPRLYQDLRLELCKAAQQVLQEVATTTTVQHDQDVILQHTTRQFKTYVDYLLLLSHVYNTLDRQYVLVEQDQQDNDVVTVVKRTCQTTGLVDVGLVQFATRLVQLGLDEQVYNAWWTTLWQDWRAQQAAEQQCSSSLLALLGQTMQMWNDLGWKLSYLINKIQPQLTAALACVCRDWKEQDSYKPTAFVTFVYNQWWHVSNAWTFLPKTWTRRLLETHLLEPHLNSHYLLKTIDLTDTEHFGHVVFLSSRLEGGLDKVVAAVVAQAKTKGCALVEEEGASPKTVVSGLLRLQEEITALQQQPTSQEQQQQQVGAVATTTTTKDKTSTTAATSNQELIPLKAIFPHVLNVHPTKVAEYFAKYMDLSLRNHKTTTPTDAILSLFRFLQAKDVFEAFYKRDLAKRLLTQKVQDFHVERQFVSLLKVECGAGYTSKMEGMFQDVEWSRESMQRYKESSDYLATNSVDVEVQTLTTGYWPVYPQYPNLHLPDELLQHQEAFLEHYKSKYQGRKIVWQYALGQCQVRFTLANKRYELLVSLPQTLVLMAFNKKEKWTLPEMAREIGMQQQQEVPEVERLLQSLSMGKEGTRVLRRVVAASDKPSAGKKIPNKINNDDTFVVNTKFTSAHRRIRITNILQRDTKEDSAKVVEGVSRDRLYLIDAVLVRILKARKTILHQQLIPQVLEQLKVPAQPSDVKLRIESLIEREYMERDSQDRNRYNYLA